MSNMSYCRFRNTLSDLEDCFQALEELRDLGGVDEFGDELSHDEKRAAIDLLTICEEMVNAEYIEDLER